MMEVCCPGCRLTFDVGGSGEVEVCDRCGTTFNRFENAVGTPGP